MFPILIHHQTAYHISGIRSRNPLNVTFVLALNGEDFLEPNHQFSHIDKMIVMRDHIENMMTSQVSHFQWLPLMQEGICSGLMVQSKNRLEFENKGEEKIFLNGDHLIKNLNEAHPDVEIHSLRNHPRKTIADVFYFFDEGISKTFDLAKKKNISYPMLELDITLKEKMEPIVSLLSTKELQAQTPAVLTSKRNTIRL